MRGLRIGSNGVRFLGFVTIRVQDIKDAIFSTWLRVFDFEFQGDFSFTFRGSEALLLGKILGLRFDKIRLFR